MRTLSDKEIAEYIRYKTAFHYANPNGIKKAVSVIGRQPDSDAYVLGLYAIFDSNGNVLCSDECDVVWVGGIVSGEGVASYSLVCDVLTQMSNAALR